MRDLKRDAEQAIGIFQNRLKTNFSYELLQCLRFLDPTVNQKRIFNQMERRLWYKKWSPTPRRCSKRNSSLQVKLTCSQTLATSFQGQVGKCIGETPLTDVTPMGTDAFTKFWSPKFAAGSTLAKFAVTLGKAAITEAAVERSFSAQVGCKISVTPPTPLCPRDGSTPSGGSRSGRRLARRKRG